MLCFYSSKTNKKKAFSWSLFPMSCLLGAIRHGVPLVMSTCHTSLHTCACPTLRWSSYLSTQTRHPGSEWCEQTFECNFPCTQTPLPFSFGTFLSRKINNKSIKRSLVPFFKPNSICMQLLSGSCGATSHMRIFSVVLAIIGVKCQVVEDIFYCHSIWLLGWLLCQLYCWLWSYLCSWCMFKLMELLHPHMLFYFLTFQLLWTFFQELILPRVISTWVQDAKFPWNGFAPYVGRVPNKFPKFIHGHIYGIAECFPMALWHMVFALKVTIFSVSSVLLCTGDCLLWKTKCLSPQIIFSLKHLKCCLLGNVLIWFVLTTRGYNRLILSERQFKGRVVHKIVQRILHRRHGIKLFAEKHSWFTKTIKDL